LIIVPENVYTHPRGVIRTSKGEEGLQRLKVEFPTEWRGGHTKQLFMGGVRKDIFPNNATADGEL